MVGHQQSRRNTSGWSPKMSCATRASGRSGPGRGFAQEQLGHFAHRCPFALRFKCPIQRP